MLTQSIVIVIILAKHQHVIVYHIIVSYLVYVYLVHVVIE